MFSGKIGTFHIVPQKMSHVFGGGEVIQPPGFGLSIHHFALEDGFVQSQLCGGTIYGLHAEKIYKYVGGHVIAEDDHKGGQIFQRGTKPRMHLLEDSEASHLGSLPKFHFFVKGKLSLIHPAEKLPEDGEFNYTGGGENLFRIPVSSKILP
jgi:hypothetical protein